MTLRASLLVCLVATASSVSTRAQDLPPEVVAKIRAVGQARFVEWVTGIALNLEEHTITQSLIGVSAPQDWKALESFAEYVFVRPWPKPAE